MDLREDARRGVLAQWMARFRPEADLDAVSLEGLVKVRIVQCARIHMKNIMRLLLACFLFSVITSSSAAQPTPAGSAKASPVVLITGSNRGIGLRGPTGESPLTDD